MQPDTFRLELVDVSAGYGNIPAINGVSFRVEQGERIGILGRNGAGKTTTLASILGLTRMFGGRILLNGEDIEGRPIFERARRGLGYVPQAREIFPSLSVEENLVAALRQSDRAPIDYVYRLFPRLRERRSNAGSQLSGGEQQMLAVARALVGRPKILLLDEPLEGLAPQVRDDLMDDVDRLVTETGVGCVLVEQSVDVVLSFAHRVLLLERGIPVFYGSTDELRGRPDILERSIDLDKG
jgi:branched-chain amino acid transport system ATP-binding protein